MKKKFLAALLATAMLLGVSACGPKDPAPSAGADNPGGTQSTAPNNQGGGTTAQGKDSVVLATSGEPIRFMAQSSQSCSGDDNLVLSNVYDCLLFLEPNGELTPALAESYEVSEDGLTYTWHLRKGVKFHDGSEMTAEDVKFTFDLGAAGPIGAALFINLESTEVVDDSTVVMHLSAPYAAFPYGVASRLGGIISKAYFDKVGGEDGYLAAPMGTGPYKFVEAVSGSHITLEAFEDYWRGPAPIKTATIQIVSDTNTQVLGLQNGDYDAIRNPSIEVCTRFDSVDNVDWNYTDSTGRITLYLAAWGGHDWDLNFRKAVQCAINKDDINTATNSGYATILDIDMCPMYGGYPTEGIETVKYDPDQAKAYLAQSSYNNEPYSILVQSGTTYEAAAKIIQAQLMAVGINCQVNAVDGQTKTSLQTNRDFDALIGENLSSLVDADGVKSFFLFNRGDPTRLYQREEELCDMFAQGAILQGDARLPYYVDACNIITQEAYMVPLYNGIITVAHNAALQGADAHCLGNFNFYYWSWAK